jgi:hypothetical protein
LSASFVGSGTVSSVNSVLSASVVDSGTIVSFALELVVWDLRMSLRLLYHDVESLTVLGLDCTRIVYSFFLKRSDRA